MTTMHDALAARDRALQAVDENADEQWKEHALAAVRRTAERAQARVNNRVHHLGYFDDELEAARVAAEFRAEHMPHANAERDTEFVDERETQEVPV